MRSRERLWSVALVVLLALVLGAGATTADARKKLPTATTAKFKAELSGTQFAQSNVTQTIDGPFAPTCELPSGTSTERIEFQASTFPLEVTELPPSEIVLTVGKSSGSVRFPVGGTVTRSNMGAAAACQDDPRMPEDCGVVPTRSWHPLLQWRTRGFQLVAGHPDSDPFRNCSGNLLYDHFPDLFGAADDEPQVVARASLRDIIDRPKKRTIVALGHGFDSFNDGRGTQGTVSIDWRITLTRQKTPRRKR